LFQKVEKGKTVEEPSHTSGVLWGSFTQGRADLDGDDEEIEEEKKKAPERGPFQGLDALGCRLMIKIC